MANEPNTVLIVEDSPVQATSIGYHLQQKGLCVVYAPDGQAGVYLAKRYLPDAIILDLEMPRMNGLEACRQLKADPKTADIPVIILTLHADRADLVMSGIDEGAIDFIPKDSFADAVLLETLRGLGVLGAEPNAKE